MFWNDSNLIKILKEGGVVVMPTDTIYGIVGKADSPSVVNRIYGIRRRMPDKPCIILIGSISELQKFSIYLFEEQKKIVKEYWPGPVSIVFNCSDGRFEYLHRGMDTLAFRLPKDESLRQLLIQTGPLIAPSANPEGMLPAKDIIEAKRYFGDAVDLYIDAGILAGKPSRLIKLHKDGSVSIIRE